MLSLRRSELAISTPMRGSRGIPWHPPNAPADVRELSEHYVCPF